MTKKTVNLENRSVAFDFENGRDFEAGLNEFTEEITLQLALHGLSQKLGDSYASAKAATEGTDESPEEYAERRVKEVFQELKEGNWTVRSGGGAPGITDLARAIAEVKGLPVDEVAATLADMEKDQKAGLRKHPAIAQVLARYRAERAEAKAKKLEGQETPDLEFDIG